MLAARTESAARVITRNCDPARIPAISQEIYNSAISLKYGASIVLISTRPSNREGFQDGLGGLRAALNFFGSLQKPAQRSRA